MSGTKALVGLDAPTQTPVSAAGKSLGNRDKEVSAETHCPEQHQRDGARRRSVQVSVRWYGPTALNMCSLARNSNPRRPG